jgi:hypothetical protein
VLSLAFMKNLNCLLIAFALCTVLSCKKRKSDPEPLPQPATNVVTGKVYGKSFTMASAKAIKKVIDLQEDGLEVYLSSSKNDGCGSPEENFAVIIRIPRKVGTFNERAAIYSEQGTSNSTLFFDGNVFEITSISATTVKGKIIKSASLKTDSSVEGSFEATICN